MYKLQGDTAENRPITRNDPVDANTLENAKAKLLNEKRTTRVSLIRAGMTLSGIAKHLGKDAAKLKSVCDSAGISNSEKNQLIAIAQVEEFSDALYDMKLPNSIGPLYQLCKYANLIELMGKNSFLTPTLTAGDIRKFATLYEKDDGKTLQAQHDAQKAAHDLKHQGKSNEAFYFKPEVKPTPRNPKPKTVIELKIDPTKYENVADLEAAVATLQAAIDKVKLGDNITAEASSTPDGRAKWIPKVPEAGKTEEEKAAAKLEAQIKVAKEKATEVVFFIEAAQNKKLDDKAQKRQLTQILGKSTAQLLKKHDPENAIHKHIERLDAKTLYDPTKAQLAAIKKKLLDDPNIEIEEDPSDLDPEERDQKYEDMISGSSKAAE